MQITIFHKITALIAFSVISVNGFLDYQIIEGYFEAKYIKHAVIVGCFNKRDQMKIAEYFRFKKQIISVLSINQISIENSLNSTNHIAVILDGDCENVQDFLLQCGKHKYFDVRHHWLISSFTTNISDIFENVPMYINSDIQMIYPRQNENCTSRNYTVEVIYNPAYDRGGTLKKYNIGFYDEENGYTVREECKYWMRRNMTGVTLKTTVVLPVPFQGKLMDYLNSERHREINTFNRFHYNLMESCKNYYNFTSTVTLSKSWGYKKKDGTFDGQVGALERKEIDYGSSPLFVKTDRARIIDYGRRTWTLRAAFIFRSPKCRNSIEIFVNPLSLYTWILTICSAGLVILFLKLSYLYEKKNIQRQAETSWSYFVICIVGALCQQGMTTTPYFLSGRIVMLCMFLLSVLIYQFYSASLVSNLLMNPPSRIKTVGDILKSNMRVGCEDILYNRDYFLYTTDKSSKELYYRKILGQQNNSNFLAPERGLELVRKGQYAFHVEIATAYPIIRRTYYEKAICELREVQMYRTQPMHSNLQKNSPYKDMFNTCLQRLAENGILSREIIFWHPTKPDCIHAARTTTFNIGLDDFYPALMVLGIGIIFSLMILLVEVYVSFKAGPIKRRRETILIYPFVK